MKIILYTILVAGFFGAASCKKCDDHDLPALAGIWQEVDEQPDFTGSTNRITFTSDGSFQTKRSLWSDVLELNNPCSGNRTQYVHGTYNVSGSQLILTGKYCDSLFATDKPDCAYGAGISEHYTMSGNDGRLILNVDKNERLRIILERQ